MPKEELDSQAPASIDSLDLLEDLYLSLEEILHNPSFGICGSEELLEVNFRLHAARKVCGGLINTIYEERQHGRPNH